MQVQRRFVADTNVLVSRLLVPASTAAKALKMAMQDGDMLVSEATMMELSDVLARRKFDPYVSIEDRREFIRQIGYVAEMVLVLRRVKACRDPKDDMFLDLALNGEAQFILTGDADLLALNPFHGVAILSPGAFLDKKFV